MILGSYFCRRYNICVDYEKETIRIGDLTIKALSKDEETSKQKANHGARKSPVEPKISTMKLED